MLQQSKSKTGVHTATKYLPEPPGSPVPETRRNGNVAKPKALGIVTSKTKVYRVARETTESPDSPASETGKKGNCAEPKALGKATSKTEVCRGIE